MTVAPKTVLEGLGMTDPEAEVYLALLQCGTATASILARKVNLPRSTVQYTCQRLRRKGVISMIAQKNRYLFSVDNPAKLDLLLAREQERVRRTETQLRAIAPALDLLFAKESVLPSVRYYEGVDGISGAWDDYLNGIPARQPILSYVHPLPADAPERSLAVLRQFMKRRIQKGVFNRLIAPKSPAALQLQQADAKSHRETRLIDRLPSDVDPSEIMICGEKICSITFQSGALLAVIIQNRSMARLLSAMFQAQWDSLELPE